jgi:hypothetical protein
MIRPRKGMPDPRISAQEFEKRFLSQYQGPAFAPLAAELLKVANAAWEGYSNHRKSPSVRKAGPEFADPDYDLSTEWIAARDALRVAQSKYEDATAASRFLIINCSGRSEHT